MKQDHLT